MPAMQMLAVWAVYVADRLLDARAQLVQTGAAPGGRKPEGLRERHFFHWRHRHVLAPMAGVAACAAALPILLYLPAGMRGESLILAAATLAYFVWVHGLRRESPSRLLARMGIKELLVGVLFTAGCALPEMGQRPGGAFLVAMGFFVLLAWLNCRAIEHWEAEPRGSLQREMNRGRPLRGGSIVAAAGMLLAAAMAAEVRIALLLAAGAMSAAVLELLDRQQNRMQMLTLRAAADLALLTPILVLPLAAALR
jgi:hypothetical protein